MTHSLGCINLLDWLMELRETFYLLGNLFIIKRYIAQEQPDGRDVQGKVWGKGTELPRPLIASHSSQISNMFTNPEAL